MILASNATSVTIALIFIFFVLFPAVITGLVIFAIAQATGERQANANYRGAGRRGQGPSQG